MLSGILTICNYLAPSLVGNLGVKRAAKPNFQSNGNYSLQHEKQGGK
jgi:hypothetical protein